MLKGWRTCIGVALWCMSQPAFAGCTLAKIAELPVTMSGLSPLVPAKINGLEEMFLADSGAFFSLLSAPTAAELKLKAEPLPWLSVKGVGGEADASVVKVKAFTLAQQPLSNMDFIVAGSIGGDYAGLLGQNILGLADVEYDLANGMIRLMEPHGLFDSRGLAHLRLGQWDKAIADYDAALAMQPKIAWSLYGRGLAKTHKGLRAEADADLAASAALDPNLTAEAKTYGIVGTAISPPPNTMPASPH